MKTVLFVTNGHGEAAIAARIAEELRALAPLRTEHFALVGERLGGGAFVDVGPQRVMPSGGLVAMGNLRAFARDLRAGFITLFAQQVRFLRSARGRYAAVVAVGDAYACLMARMTRRPLAFVGTAKSVYVAPYGPGERRIIAGAQCIFVRDFATAEQLREQGVPAQAPGNVIVDLVHDTTRSRTAVEWRAPLRLALLPGSRPRAYADAQRLAEVVAALRTRVGPLDAVLSIAPSLDPAGFAPAIALGDLRTWNGPLDGLFAGATLVIGQSGTANEAAAAYGVPVVALELDDAPRDAWYRKRQIGLLGEAMLVVPGDVARATEAIAALLADEPQRAHMAWVGRERMGGPGGAHAIAQAVLSLVTA